MGTKDVLLREVLTAEEESALAELAEHLWEQRESVVSEWSERLINVLSRLEPGVTPPDRGALRVLNHAFLTVILERMRAKDFAGLTHTYYEMNRAMIEMDLGGGGTLTLPSLYTSAHASLRAVESHLGDLPARTMLAYSRFAAHLIMLVGLAYSDARQASLQQAREQLEHQVKDRTAELAREKALADTIIETLPGLFFLVDARPRFVRWNPELERISELSAEELANIHPLDLFDAESHPLLAEKMRQAFEEGGASAEADLKARSGATYPRFFSSRRMQLPQGPMLVGVGIDISERRSAEEQVQREKRFAESIIESLPGVFYVFDESGRFLRWNRNFETVLQYDADEIPQLHPLDLFGDEEKDLIAERIGLVFQDGQATVEGHIVAKDRTRRPYYFTGRLVSFDDRPCVVGMGIDITDRKHAEEELQRTRTAQLFASLLESAPDAVIVTNRSGSIVFANSESERLFGYQSEELLGRPLEVLIPAPADQAPTSAHSPPSSFEARGRRHDGSWVAIDVKVSPVDTEDGLLLTSSIRDITERKRAEAEIHRLNANLERRVAERTIELARSNADLEQFAYVASHDLQEPLRAVSSYTQLLARRYHDQIDGDARNYIDRTVAAVGRMQGLIRDLLAYSRVGTGDERFAPTSCEEVLANVLADLQAAIAEAGATVTYDALPVLTVDPAQLRQLLQNLIGNAIKFHASQPPRVHVSANRNGSGWLFNVRDNGIGIQPEYAERVFVIFQRLHSRRAYPGTGVGLAICKKIVERHGGSIWIDESVSEGTNVCFHLPANPLPSDDV